MEYQLPYRRQYQHQEQPIGKTVCFTSPEIIHLVIFTSRVLRRLLIIAKKKVDLHTLCDLEAKIYIRNSDVGSRTHPPTFLFSVHFFCLISHRGSISTRHAESDVFPNKTLESFCWFSQRIHLPEAHGILQQVCDHSRPLPKRRHVHWHHQGNGIMNRSTRSVR